MQTAQTLTQSRVDSEDSQSTPNQNRALSRPSPLAPVSAFADPISPYQPWKEAASLININPLVIRPIEVPAQTLTFDMYPMRTNCNSAPLTSTSTVFAARAYPGKYK